MSSDECCSITLNNVFDRVGLSVSHKVMYEQDPVYDLDRAAERGLQSLTDCLVCFYFSSFEAGIADAISSFKRRKIFIFMKNRHFLNLII